MQMPECHFSRYVFVVTGMSYIIDSSGTSKVVKAHEDIFCANGIGYVAIFPISRSRGEGANWHCTTTGCYGFTVDGKFVGVMTAKEVLNTLLEFDKAGKICIGILVHHIIRNDIDEVKWILEKIENVPVVYYLHDFYTCCINPNLMKNDIQSCIDRDIPCKGCCYLGKKEEHLEKIQHFLRAFENRITFVAPAEYTKEHWIAFYPEYADKTEARRAFYAGDYKTVYEQLNNKKLGSSDEIMYQCATEILSLQHKLDSYHNRMALGEDMEALDALFQGVDLYIELAGSDTSGSQNELTAIYQQICTILQDDYGVSPEEAVEINGYDNETYTRKLDSILHGTEFYLPGEEPVEETPSVPEDVLPDEEAFIDMGDNV